VGAPAPTANHTGFPAHCGACAAGVRERWLESVVEEGRQAVPMKPDALLDTVLPWVNGLALYTEPHSLGAVVTACAVDDLLPATSPSSLPPGGLQRLPVRFDARGRWTSATEAARYVGRELLPRCNRSTMAVQAHTNLPFLADLIVKWRLATVWMDDMCADAEQQGVLRHIVEGSGHFDGVPLVDYVGWFNHTRQPNPEILGECIPSHKLVTLASDWSEQLSFLSALPPASSLAQPRDATVVDRYSPDEVYVAVLMSDGDNIAEDWSTLRPVVERRLELQSTTPISWTVSNRWAHIGAPILRWFYSALGSTGGYDSALMGPSGFGYLFPGNVTSSASRAAWAERTAAAASALGMEAYVHWDVDLALDPASPERAASAIALLNGTAVRGAFMLASVPLGSAVGDVAVINAPLVPWGFRNASAAAATLGDAPRGTVSYVYQTLGTDPALIDELASRTAQQSPHVRFLGYRELIRVAHLKEAARRRAQ